MKPHASNKKNLALTRLDVLVIVLIAAFLLGALLPVQRNGKERAKRINCVHNLGQINLALRAWEADGGRETNLMVKSIPAGLNRGQKAWIDGMGLSNILRSQKILLCPADETTSTNPPGFPVRISYFLNLDARETYPQMILSGDDDLVFGIGTRPRPTDNAAEGDVPVTPGILVVSPTLPIAWGKRHEYVGNISFADGSVAEESADGLQTALQYGFNGTPLITNRLAIP